MTTLFLSHSSQDRALALELKGRLEAAGYDAVFLSSSPTGGLLPGQDWERELYRRINACQGMVALCTPASTASQWCFAEVTQARSLKKPVLPVVQGSASPPTLLQGVQAARVDPDVDAAMPSLLRGLREAGLAPGQQARRDWTRRVLVGAALALVGAVAVWLLGREPDPARVTIASLPSARFLMDERELGTTPVVDQRIAVGEHVLRLERRGFLPYRREVRLESGSVLDIERVLIAEDPADPEALTPLAKAFGITRSDVEIERSSEEGAPWQVLFPRGALLEPPTHLRLWSREGGAQVRVALMSGQAGAAVPLWETTLDLPVGAHAVELPADVRARLSVGGAYSVVLYARGSAPTASVDSHVVPAADLAGLPRLLERLQGFPSDDLAGDVLRTEAFVGAGLAAEAFEKAEALVARLGPRKELVRLALACLERAGLRDEGIWAEWLERWADAKP